MRFEVFAAALVLLLAGCGKPAGPQYSRIAIPPLENLTGDSGLEWWGPAVAELVAAAITGSPRANPVRVESWWDAPATRATHVLHGAIERDGSRIRAEAFLEDLGRGGMLRIVVEEEAAVGPALLAERIAVRLGLCARPVTQYHAEAVRAYVEAFRTPDPVGALEKAIATDPDFGLPYLHLLRLRMEQGDRAAAEAVLAAARKARLDPVDRNRLEALGAGLTSAPVAYRRALQELARLTPADPEVFQRLALQSLAARDYSPAASYYREALARDPASPMLLNEAAYALAYAGQFAGALSLLRQYRDLQPADPNPPDSLGDICFQAGKFAEAATYYLESAEKDPAFAGG
ncbi:MAG: hypothetical protein ACPL88_06930, partial [Bryobacteraceae bacterium]